MFVKFVDLSIIKITLSTNQRRLDLGKQIDNQESKRPLPGMIIHVMIFIVIIDD